MARRRRAWRRVSVAVLCVGLGAATTGSVVAWVWKYVSYRCGHFTSESSFRWSGTWPAPVPAGWPAPNRHSTSTYSGWDWLDVAYVPPGGSGPALVFGEERFGWPWYAADYTHTEPPLEGEWTVAGAGLIADTVVYATAWYLLILAIPLCRAGRRRFRVSRGMCPACGYDLRGSPGVACPECGASHSRAAKAPRS